VSSLCEGVLIDDFELDYVEIYVGDPAAQSAGWRDRLASTRWRSPARPSKDSVPCF
jgi:hypothetical protein